jgi:hypothetical protein
MFQFLMQHQFWSAVVLYWIYSAAVSSMPDPAADTNPGYTWLYRFLHTIAGNLTTAFSGKIPGLKTLVLILAIPLVLVSPACAATHYVVHPGALNPVDSAAYDTLLIAEATIDQARLDFKSGQLPAGAEPAALKALDALVRSYNIARDSWLTYRGAISTNAPADVYLSQLNQHLTDLATAIRGLREPANASPTRSASATARSLKEGRSNQEKEAK